MAARAAAPVTGAGRCNVYVALLRGINLGGKNKLPMKDLVAIFTDLGCREVSHFIQSGNILFQASSALVNRLPRLVGAKILDQFGFSSPVLIRSSEQLRDVSRNNPFSRAATEKLHVAFLSDRPKPKDIAQLDPQRSPPDRFVVRGQEIYLSLPNGVAKTKLTNAYFDSKLATTSTLRNWNTLEKLIELTQ